MVRFKVVFFNAGGTLLQLKNNTLPKLYSSTLSSILKREISTQFVYQAFRKAEEWTLSRKDWSLFSDLDQRKYQNAFYNHLGINNRKEINRIETELAEMIELEFILHKDAKNLLQKLQNKHQFGIISNWDESLIDILENLGIMDYFESITLSGDIGVNKPDPKIFKAALNDFPDIKAKETVYLGDDYHTDIIPAQKLKMFAIFYDQGPAGLHGHPFQPNVKGVRITDLFELPEVLKRYSS